MFNETVKALSKSNRSFSCKAPRLAFSFLPPVRFEIFTAGFSSQIFIFPLVLWLKKSDYSSLLVLRNLQCDADMLVDIFQIFSKNNFTTVIHKLATVIHKLSYYEKQSLAKKLFPKISQSSHKNTCVVT